LRDHPAGRLAACHSAQPAACARCGWLPGRHCAGAWLSQRVAGLAPRSRRAQAAGCEQHTGADIIHECGPGPLGPGPAGGPLRASPDPTIADWTSRFAEMVRDSRGSAVPKSGPEPRRVSPVAPGCEYSDSALQGIGTGPRRASPVAEVTGEAWANSLPAAQSRASP
jgi:hypothetical protein